MNVITEVYPEHPHLGKILPEGWELVNRRYGAATFMCGLSKDKNAYWFPKKVLKMPKSEFRAHGEVARLLLENKELKALQNLHE